MSFTPAYLVVTAPRAAPSRMALLLHGILGSAKNWRSFARRLVERLPDWSVVLLDQRNHGDSPEAPGPHTLSACAEDLARLCDVLGILPEAVIGHSFGGKVALTYARDQWWWSDGLGQVWVLDSVPGARMRTPDEPDRGVAQLVEALDQVPQPLSSRTELVETLTALGFGPDLTGWMTTNLRRAADGFRWRFELDGVREMLRSYFAEDLWPALEGGQLSPDVHVVRAARNELWTPSVLERFAQLPSSTQLHTLPDAGHWVHVDNPDGLLELLADWLA